MYLEGRLQGKATRFCIFWYTRIRAVSAQAQEFIFWNTTFSICQDDFEFKKLLNAHKNCQVWLHKLNNSLTQRNSNKRRSPPITSNPNIKVFYIFFSSRTLLNKFNIFENIFDYRPPVRSFVCLSIRTNIFKVVKKRISVCKFKVQYTLIYTKK